MANKFKSNTVSIVYNSKTGKRIGSIYEVKAGSKTLYVGKRGGFVFKKAYTSIQKAANAFEAVAGKNKVVYS